MTAFVNLIVETEDQPNNCELRKRSIGGLIGRSDRDFTIVNQAMQDLLLDCILDFSLNQGTQHGKLHTEQDLDRLRGHIIVGIRAAVFKSVHGVFVLHTL